LTKEIEHEFTQVEGLAQHEHDTAVTEEGRHEFEVAANALKKLGAKHKGFDHHSIEAFKLIHDNNIDQALTLLPKIEAEEGELVHGLKKLLLEEE
jgi:hypothetical protein